MLYANDKHGNKINARKDLEGFCPECGEQLIPRCGEIKIWHWAHKAKSKCSYTGGETYWHLWWKSQVPSERCEVKIGSCRADIVTPAGLVVELQKSSIAPQDITKRERQYRKMIWLFDIFRQYRNVISKEYDFGYVYGEYEVEQFEIIQRDGYYLSFIWRWAPRILKFVTKPVFLDYGEKIIYIVRLYRRASPMRGWGYVWSKSYFIRHVLNGYWLPSEFKRDNQKVVKPIELPERLREAFAQIDNMQKPKSLNTCVIE